MLRRLSVVVCFSLAVSCASAPIKKIDTVDLAKADQLVADGCYDCLTDALAIYQRVGVGKARPLVIQRIFETDLLLGLRLKELALSGGAQFDAARALVPELSPAFPAAKYLEIANGVPADPNGGIPGADVAIAQRAVLSPLKAYKEFLAGGASATLNDYLTASLDCTVPYNGPPIRIDEISRDPRQAMKPAPAPAPQKNNLMTYRRANCVPLDREALGKLMTDEPKWVEAGVFLGRVRSLRPAATEFRDSRVLLTAAEAKWPRSASVLYGLGTLNQTAGDCRAAVGYYDKTLREYGQHESAHLGRLMCLSYLTRHEEAIAEASGMIATKINVGEAYYWRAWNKRETNQLPAARADSDIMKTLLFNGRVMTLAGQIEHDVDDLPVAEKDLTDAVRLGLGENCVAQWYWSLVQLKKQAWPEAADGFVKSMACYELDRSKTVTDLEAMKKLQNVDEDWRNGQIANFEEEIKDDDSQISASAFNAAVNFARAQNRDKALQYCDLAEKDPARAAQVAELRKLIVK